jgi:hypothetical protein
MQIFGKRYFRDRRLYRVALRLIHYNVRTMLIVLWTGLNKDRVKHLIDEYGVDVPGGRPRRRGGPTLKAVGSLLGPKLNGEAAIAAVYCRLEGVVPPSPARPALPAFVCAERLCRGYRRYRKVVRHARLSCERVMALMSALNKGDDIALSQCTGPCQSHAAILVDPRSLAPHWCSRCVRAQRAAKRTCKVRPGRACGVGRKRE